MVRDLFDKNCLLAESCIRPFPQEKPLKVVDTVNTGGQALSRLRTLQGQD